MFSSADTEKQGQGWHQINGKPGTKPVPVGETFETGAETQVLQDNNL